MTHSIPKGYHLENIPSHLIALKQSELCLWRKTLTWTNAKSAVDSFAVCLCSNARPRLYKLGRFHPFPTYSWACLLGCGNNSPCSASQEARRRCAGGGRRGGLERVRVLGGRRARRPRSPRPASRRPPCARGGGSPVDPPARLQVARTSKPRCLCCALVVHIGFFLGWLYERA